MKMLDLGSNNQEQAAVDQEKQGHIQCNHTFSESAAKEWETTMRRDGKRGSHW